MKILFEYIRKHIKGPRDEEFISNEITKLINQEIPEGYHLKQLIVSDFSYDNLCLDEWIVDLKLVLEKN